MPRPSSSQQAEDEALALALQMQFERESQAQQQQQQIMPPPVAPRVAARPSSRPPSRGRSVTRAADISDEEIARRVQEQEIAAATGRRRSQSPVVIVQGQIPRSRSNSSRQRARSSAPSSPSIRRTRSEAAPGSPTVVTLPRSRAASPAPVVITTDEDFARQLAAEESRRGGNRSNSRTRSRSRQRAEPAQQSGGYVFPPPDNGRRSTAPTELASSSMSDEGGVPSSNFLDEDHRHSTLQDAAMARRMEQEMQDELVAERLQQREQRRASKQRATQLQPTASQPRRRRNVCGTLVTIATIVGAVVALVYYFVILDGSVPSINLTPEDFADEDPFDALGPEDAKRWANSGNGLALTVLNCLETKWYQYFYDAVDDWDDGYPDTLSLTTEFRDYEYDCDTENGYVKVCNGNYGNTRWKGINMVMIDHTDSIYASSARMNEFYMPERDDSQWQYTMCHELGHAWGLPHTDENFNNADKGDCMDYTNNPEVNKQPAKHNFEFLYELYGLVPDAAPYVPPTPAPVEPTTSPPTSAPVSAPVGTEAIEGLEVNEQPGNGRNRNKNGGRRVQEEQQVNLQQQRQGSIRRANQKKETLPRWLRDAVDEALDQSTGRRLQSHRWRVIHQHDHGELHEVDLPRGFRLQVHKLLATPEEIERYG